MVPAISLVSMLSGIAAFFYWLSLPPASQPWAAYVSMACWTAIVAKQGPLTKSDYFRLWFVASLMWLALLQGIRLANPILYPGWIALSLYVAVYVPLFVGVARFWTHQFRCPVSISVPMTWVACELVRAYFATGFSACMLAHSQTPWPFLLSIASHFGSYGVSMFVALGGVCLLHGCIFLFKKTEIIATNFETSPPMIEMMVSTVLLLNWTVGSFLQLRSYDAEISMRPPKALGKFLVVQADMPTAWDVSLEELKIGWERYEQQTRMAAESNRDSPIDAVLWPESAFTGGIIEWDGEPFDTSAWQMDTEQFSNTLARNQENFRLRIQIVLEPFGKHPPALLVGSNVYSIQRGQSHSYNAAVFVRPSDPIQTAHYAKRHLVMFGEYVPVLCWFPGLCSNMGIPLASVGQKAEAFALPSGAILSPTICFEDVIPHMVRNNLVERSDAALPNLLVNLTNDGWFRGSSILDHHLNNAILCAVENRRPMLIAANQGISAWIDSHGRIQKLIPRLESGTFMAEPIPDGRWGAWQMMGDWPAKFVAVVCFFPCLFGLAKRFARRRHLPGKNRV